MASANFPPYNNVVVSTIIALNADLPDFFGHEYTCSG
jgi:hypothetical protein